MIDEAMDQEFSDWLIDRPEIIKNMALKLKPWNRYRIKKTGQHCNILSYSEDGTVKVTVNGHDSHVLNGTYMAINQTVFGLYPDDLEIIE